MEDLVGQLLGHYRLISLLGRGGFAEVYLGEHLSLKTLAAIKVLNTRLVKDDVEEFLKEARTVAHLIHPQIVRIFDFEVQLDAPFLVMDYAPNGTLRQRHPKGTQLPLLSIVDYVKQVTCALQYAHDQKIIHRDIKPENMLIGRQNEILLSDFGIALIAQTTRLQNTQEVVGTAYYMAPEQFQGKPRFASDQYSLGIVVYEWLTGSRPFNGSFNEIASQHMFVSPPPLRERFPSISPEVEQIMMIALAKNPNHRFANIKAFAVALEEASRSPSFFVPFASSHSVTWPVQTLLPDRPFTPVTMSSTQFDMASPQYIHPLTMTPPGKLTPQPSIVTPPNLSSQLPSPVKSLPDVPVQLVNLASPDRPPVPKKGVSRRVFIGGLAVTAGLAVGGSSIVWLVLSQKPALDTKRSISHRTQNSTLGLTRSIYRGHNSNVLVVGWSPDGRRIASGSDDMTVQLWDATTGSNAFTYHGHTSSVYAVAWAHDGTRIVSGGFDKIAQVWDAVSGRNILTYTNHTDSVNALIWSPDSKLIASASSDKTLQVWNASDKSLVFKQSHASPVRTVAWSPNGRYLASAGDDNIVDVLDASSGAFVYSYRGHSNRIWTVAWSPDSTRIASASDDQTVQVWNATNGGNVLIYNGHSDSVTTVDWWFSHIASGSRDKTVQVWDAFSGTLAYTYTDHIQMVTSLRWSPTGTYVASASDDKTVRVWQGV
jgi:eukaryotic-like serine/threonine-protein kinase